LSYGPSSVVASEYIRAAQQSQDRPTTCPAEVRTGRGPEESAVSDRDSPRIDTGRHGCPEGHFVEHREGERSAVSDSGYNSPRPARLPTSHRNSEAGRSRPPQLLPLVRRPSVRASVRSWTGRSHEKRPREVVAPRGLESHWHQFR